MQHKESEDIILDKFKMESENVWKKFERKLTDLLEKYTDHTIQIIQIQA